MSMVMLNDIKLQHGKNPTTPQIQGIWQVTFKWLFLKDHLYKQVVCIISTSMSISLPLHLYPRELFLYTGPVGVGYYITLNSFDNSSYFDHYNISSTVCVYASQSQAVQYLSFKEAPVLSECWLTQHSGFLGIHCRLECSGLVYPYSSIWPNIVTIVSFTTWKPFRYPLVN